VNSNFQICIRRARLNDARVIAQFNAALALETEHRELDLNRVLRGVRALLRDRAKGIYFVAEINRTLAGQVLITYEWSDWRNGNFWWIQSVYVRPEFRGLGVFKTLFAHIQRLAHTRKDVCGLRLYVERENTNAKRAYKKLGLKKTSYELLETDFILDEAAAQSGRVSD